MQKIILDTDIGTDVDDALALGLILSSPEAELLGVTTVHGDTRRRADAAREVIRAFGSAVRVEPGIGEARLSGGPEWILDRLRAHPDAVIAAIGPLSNLSACVDSDPGLMRSARIVLMGGMTGCAFPEGNIAGDPEAAERVFSCGAEIRLVSLDVTLTADFPYAFIERLAAHPHPARRLLYHLALRWRDEFLIPFHEGQGLALAPGDPFKAGLHDPMTVAAALHPEWFDWRPSQILIETQGRYTRGVTVDHKNVFTGHVPSPNCRLAARVDRERLMGWIEERLLKATPPEE
jgi:inosine-uridine nucleoside N-ribohydrolase